jgi:hypothetical protein
MIPFPKIHIAESALNRIMNAMDDMAPMIPSFNTAPIPPADPIALGQRIDDNLQTPVEPVSQPDDPVAAAASEESIFGGSPLAGAVDSLFSM